MSDTKVGQLIDETAQRDAIHIAIAPVISAGNYRPGEHVGFMPDGRVGIRAKAKIGIIDPFLPDGVSTDQRCYIFLYPQTVTGMRHHWAHPSFDTGKVESTTEKAISEKWLRQYATEHNSYDEPERAFQRLIEGIKTGEIYFHGSDLHGLYELDEADALKEHAQTFLGIKISWDTFTFACSC